MLLTRSLPRFAGLFAALLAICNSGCSVPLAPGYRILKESREVHFVAGQPPQLEIRVRYLLQNSGTIELSFIDVILPDEKAFGRRNVRVEMNGQAVVPGKLPEQYPPGSPDVYRLKADAWEKKQRRELLVAYDFVSPEDSGERITLGESDFHVGTHGWYPELQPPKRFLAPIPKRPDRTQIAVRVPSNFSVLSRGSAQGRKQSGGEMEYRFQLRKGDLEPYIVAGRYAESSTGQKSGATVFWTHEPIPVDLKSVELRVAAAWGVLDTNFGTLDKSIRNLRVVEASELRAAATGDEGPAAASFPGGVLVNPAELHLGIGCDAFLEIVTRALARNWFGEEMRITADAAIGMGRGLPEYATIVVDEARNGEAARSARVIKLLHDYDEARKQAPEKPVGWTRWSDSPEQRRIAFTKAPLFYIALEDAYGEAPVRIGLRELAVLLQGREAGYDDLRAALEHATRQNLAEIFRVWLERKGLPEAFRAKYEEAHLTQP